VTVGTLGVQIPITQPTSKRLHALKRRVERKRWKTQRLKLKVRLLVVVSAASEVGLVECVSLKISGISGVKNRPCQLTVLSCSDT